jgi:GTP-binding protein
MKIKAAEFIKSCVEIQDCPHDYPEYAFIGRSNVGKSSLINLLTNNKNLAKTSSKPGKTQTINFFMINYQWYLVDLPGYGYAKTSKANRIIFEKLINKYIFQSSNLMSLFVLIDISIPAQKNDIDFINNLGINEIPFCIVFTKSDKIKKNILETNIKNYKKELLKTWEELPEIFITSSKTSIGKTDILNYIDKINQIYKRQNKK